MTPPPSKNESSQTEMMCMKHEKLIVLACLCYTSREQSRGYSDVVEWATTAELLVLILYKL